MITKIAKNIYADRFKRYLVLALIVIGILLIVHDSWSTGQAVVSTGFDVHFFFSPTCPHCTAQKIFNEELMKKYPSLNFVYHDVTMPANSALLFEFANKHKIPQIALGIPATFFGEHYFIGFDNAEISGKAIESALNDFIKGEGAGKKIIGNTEKDFSGKINLPFFGEADVLGFSLPLLAIVLGLIDGFNPCAMWVLVYLISLILSINDKKKIWLLVGSFLFASGALYFLFMTAWLNVFLWIGYVKILTIVIGLFALGIGVNDLKVYFTKKDVFECEVVGVEGKKKTMGKIQAIVESPLTWMTMLAMIGLAFIVNSIEFVCSSAIPAVFTQILALSGLSEIKYYLYILLYDLFFMLDDLIIFGLAAFAVSEGFIGHKYVKYCKLIGGIVLVVLGFLLVFIPNLLGGLG